MDHCPRGNSRTGDDFHGVERVVVVLATRTARLTEIPKLAAEDHAGTSHGPLFSRGCRGKTLPVPNLVTNAAEDGFSFELAA
mmetsp:Transcript_11456/g.28981  ORF Transcript_11456/g.28981 Transcript_11456/m.28981 type:complete len:82 (+) Transcript_11456:252-497(+)